MGSFPLMMYGKSTNDLSFMKSKFWRFIVGVSRPYGMFHSWIWTLMNSIVVIVLDFTYNNGQSSWFGWKAQIIQVKFPFQYSIFSEICLFIANHNFSCMPFVLKFVRACHTTLQMGTFNGSHRKRYALKAPNHIFYSLQSSSACRYGRHQLF